LSKYTQKIWTTLVPNANPNTFVGDSGHIFYDPSTGNLRLSDGTTPGGIPLLITGNTSGNSGIYSNANVASYLPTDSTIIGIENSIAGTNIAWIANALSQQGQIDTFLAGEYSNSNVASYLPTDPTIIGIENGLLGANVTIVSINSNVTAANSAILSLQNGLSGANLNIAGANAAIAVLQSEVYSNSNVASYLPIYTGNINAGNIMVTSNIIISGTETTAGKSVAISLHSANYSLLSTDFIVVFTASATATLNSALPKGTSYCIKNSYNTTGITNVVPTSGTIEGGPYLLITQPSQSIDISWDGISNWNIF